MKGSIGHWRECVGGGIDLSIIDYKSKEMSNMLDGRSTSTMKRIGSEVDEEPDDVLVSYCMMIEMSYNPWLFE